jgi:cystathionine beta-lyase
MQGKRQRRQSMKYDFDKEINRQGTHSVKWEFIQEGENLLHWEHTDRCFGENRLLPLWVADMDFPCPPPVVDALVARAQHGIYGYSEKTEGYYHALVDWMKRRQGWHVDPAWVCTSPGVVPALHMLVRTFVAPGEKVLIQPPVYYPFFRAIEHNSAEIISNPLVYEGGRYRMDLADLEQKSRDPQCRMLILCNPHNPVGRVWTRAELLGVAEICLERNILVVSDEIHGDLMLQGNVFTPFASVGEPFAQKAIICTAPSKTFNLAGLQTSNIIIPDPDQRARFQKTLQSNGLIGVNAFGLVALEAAYTHGEEWLGQALAYIGGNLLYLQDYVSRNIPQITVIPPEGTYLVWLDCRRLGLDKWRLKRLMLNEARVYLDDGFMFGSEGEGFQRINIACPRAILAEALERIKTAIERLPLSSSNPND